MRRTRPRGTRSLTLLVASAALLGLSGTLAVPASAATPTPPGSLPSKADSLARYEAATTCAPVQPGTEALRELILDTWGRQTVGTARACPTGSPVNSEHHEGRALDWMLDAADPEDAALAEEFLDWLLEDDHEMARRLGVMYVIWDGRMWSSYRADDGWRTYTGPNPHTDHVHVSLSVRGAARETSWWTGETSPIDGHWVALGGEDSALGSALASSGDFRDGRRKRYENGSIVWSAATQAREVRGAIADAYFSDSRAKTLGLPVTDQLPTPTGDGRFNHFEDGSLYWSPSTGAHLVRGVIRDTWASLGWEASELGFPTSDEHAVDGGRRSDFTGGSITWDRSSGKVTVRYS